MNNKNLTIEAYAILFEFETTLTNFINERMFDEYNYKMYTLLPRQLEKSLLHDKISYLRRFKCFSNLFSPHDILVFEQCITIRNKICHMKTINSNEFTTLLAALSILTSVVNNQYTLS